METPAKPAPLDPDEGIDACELPTAFYACHCGCSDITFSASELWYWRGGVVESGDGSYSFIERGFYSELCADAMDIDLGKMGNTLEQELERREQCRKTTTSC